MIKAADIFLKANKKYGSYLSSLVIGEEFSRIVIPCDKKPSTDFALYKQEYDNIVSQSKEVKGFGYTITWCTVTKKSIARQDLPQEISFDTESDYVRFLKKDREVGQFKIDLRQILGLFPELKDWLVRNPQKVLDYSQQWTDLLKVVAYFKSNPSPNLYIRELPIPVHTKFIENNKKILKEILDIVIAEHVLSDEKVFEQRYHLKYVESLLRLRSLDTDLSQRYFYNIDDISFPVSLISNLNITVKNVFIVENQVNFLAFPKVKNSIVIWGHGYGVSSIKNVNFLHQAKLYYWGDYDIQGFEILSQFRGYYPQTNSFLMDTATFNLFYEGNTGVPNNVSVELNLTSDEYELYNQIKANNWRLEQEKIPQQYLVEKLKLLHLI